MARGNDEPVDPTKEIYIECLGNARRATILLNRKDVTGCTAVDISIRPDEIPTATLTQIGPRFSVFALLDAVVLNGIRFTREKE